MKAVKYERTAAQEGKLIAAERKAREIAARDGVTIAEAMKQVYLNGGSVKKTGKKSGKKTGKVKKANRSKPKGKKGGSMLDYLFGR